MAKERKSRTDKHIIQHKRAIAAEHSTVPVDKLSFLKNIPLQLLLLTMLGIIAYSNTFHAPFAFDDYSSIVENPAIKDLPTFLSRKGYEYIPCRFIGYITIALNYKLGGLEVTGYHIVNLAIHIITAWLVYALARLTLKTPFFKTAGSHGSAPSNSKFETLKNFIPLIAALLFIAHPVQTQAVTYIIQRLASLATLFYLTAIVCYVKARLASSKQFMSLYFFLALGSAILAFRTKEIAFTLPLVVALYEFSFFGSSIRKKLLFLAPFLLLSLAILLGMLYADKPLGEYLSDISEQTRVQSNIPRLHYLLTQFSVIITYIRLLIFPVNQNLDYDYPVYDSLFTPRVFFSFLFLLTLFGTALYLYIRTRQASGSRSKIPDPQSRLIAFGILWFFITLSVESSVIPIVDFIFEHRVYLPSVGAFLSAAAAVSLLVERVGQRTLAIGTIVVVLTLTFATWKRNLVWRESLSLWQDVVAKSPEKGRAHSSLGKVLFDLNQTDDAIEHYQHALRLDPGFLYVHVNLGAAYHRKKLYELAIGEYNAALPLKAHFAELHNNLGSAYNELGILDKAVDEYQLVLQQQPENTMVHTNMGIIYHKKGQLDLAVSELQTALQLNPNSSTAHNALARVYLGAQLPGKAIEHFKTAISLDPADADSKFRLGKVFAITNMIK